MNINFRKLVLDQNKEVKYLLNICKEYDQDNKGYYIDCLKNELLTKEYTVSDFIQSVTQGLWYQLEENKDDMELVKYYQDFINRFNNLDIEKLQAWQDGIIVFTNMEYDTLYINPTLRKVI